MERITEVHHGGKEWATRFVKSLSLLLAFSIPLMTRAQSDTDSSGTGISSSWFTLRPVNTLTLRSYALATRYPSLTYRLVNSDGESIERGWTHFGTVEGEGSFFSFLSLRYTLQASGTEALHLKRGSVKLQDFGLSLELARGSVWMGHGYHGSFLLSNHAEPFTLVKFQTEEAFRIPYLGEFNYMMFNGWPVDFKIFGHRISWMPVPWLEFGANQTAIYTQDYKFWEILRVIAATESNVASRYNTDQRASIDIAVSLKPLAKWTLPVVDGKVYFEYAGEDLFAAWQKDDDLWVGPFGFEFLDPALLYGLWLATDAEEFRFEYAQNFRNQQLFHTFQQFGYQKYNREWYNISGFFVNGGAVMGHHMGPQADDLYFELKKRWPGFDLKLSYNLQRRGLVLTEPWPPHENPYPETFSQYGIEGSYQWNAFSAGMFFMWHRYKNLDYNPDVLVVDPVPRTSANEYILGLTLQYTLPWSE